MQLASHWSRNYTENSERLVFHYRILGVTVNVSSLSPYTGNFHGNLTYGTRLGLELLAPLTNYKHPLVPPTIFQPPLPQYSEVSRLSTSVDGSGSTSLGNISSLFFPLDLQIIWYSLGNLQLGMWRLIALDISILLHISSEIPYIFSPIMGNWDSWGPSDCLDLHPLTLLKDGCLFNGTYSYKK